MSIYRSEFRCIKSSNLTGYYMSYAVMFGWYVQQIKKTFATRSIYKVAWQTIYIKSRIKLLTFVHCNPLAKLDNTQVFCTVTN